MKQFIVSLSAQSWTLDLATITRLIGCEPTGGHEPRVLAETGDRSCINTYWWVDSGTGDEATMQDHADSLMSRLAPLVAEVVELTSSGDLDDCIGVGIMYDTYTTSVRLPPRLVAFAADLGASFEVSSYPTEFDSPTSSEPRND